jgi:hypothetical protein
MLADKAAFKRVIPRLNQNVSTGLLMSLQCKKCDLDATQAELHDEEETKSYLLMTCIRCSCNWFICVACQCRLARQSLLNNHFLTPKHTSKFGPQTTTQSMSAVVSLGSQVCNTQEESTQGNKKQPELLQLPKLGLPPQLQLPKLELRHLQLLNEIYTDVPKASTMQIIKLAFPLVHSTERLELPTETGTRSMMYYFLAEHESENAGVQYLVTRAFQKGVHYSQNKLATKPESFWQFRCFVQYMSMTERQRVRQAGIINTNFINQSSFTNTWIPEENELNQLYGRSNKDTIWHNLPIPRVQNFSGIGYVSPLNILRYLLGFSTEMEHFTVLDDQVPGDATFNVHQSSFAIEWKKELTKLYPSEVHLLIWLTHWRDGFGPNRIKNNRKTAVAWTASFSTPKGRINAIDNTRLIALGMKKNDAWTDVEHQFEQDMRQFSNGLKPIPVYHGGLKKIIHVFVRPFACLTDKVERSDITQTLGCTSPYHKQFGQILDLDGTAILDTKAIQKFLEDTRRGEKNPRQYDWSSSMLSGNSVGAVLPACSICRKNNVDWLRREPSQRNPAIELCDKCANWKVSPATEGRLRYPAPPNYPTEKRTMLNPPDGVAPPLGREPSPCPPTGTVGPIHYLPPIKGDFKTMIEGTRFCFFNAMAKSNKGWNLAITKSYLRTLGINEAQASLIYKAAQKAHSEKVAAQKAGQEPNAIDWKDPYYVGDYRFPAAWVSDLQMPNYIELLMHLLFLGVASSSFDQCSAYFKELNKMAPFQKNANNLLKILNGFNLQWLLAYPFGGTKLTTGAWVSENWLAWVRLSTIFYSFCAREGAEDEKKGCNDVLRMVICFQALVARIMSHAGSNAKSTRMVDSLVREFLSSVRELDVRITNGKGCQTTWTKSNYASMVNLVACMILLGSLTNLWDGGGKGERYIQEIKPHIPRGVRDGFLFLIRVMERVYKMDCIALIEKSMFPSKKIDNEDGDDDSSLGSVMSVELEEENGYGEEVQVLQGMEIDLQMNIEIDTAMMEEESFEEYTTPMESEQMQKARTFYVYRNLKELQDAIHRKLPICFIAVGNKKVPDYYVVHRARTLGWKKITFNDVDGKTVCGVWYATMFISDTDVPPPLKVSALSVMAHLSAVAIPLKYAVGENYMVDHGEKCCVITNLWTTRNNRGIMELPSLHFDIYQDRDSSNAND